MLMEPAGYVAGQFLSLIIVLLHIVSRRRHSGWHLYFRRFIEIQNNFHLTLSFLPLRCDSFSAAEYSHHPRRIDTENDITDLFTH